MVASWLWRRILSTQSRACVKGLLSAVVDSAHETHERIVVTRNAVPTEVVIAVEDLESLEETLAVLQGQDTMRQLVEVERGSLPADAYR